eukprot:PhM_4_TR117/c0_g1_i1/m.71955
MLSTLLSSLFWVWCLMSQCMSMYVLLASGEGWRWFQFRLNPYLISTASIGTLLAIAGVHPPAECVHLTAILWSFFAFFVTLQHWDFRVWQHITSVNVPLVALAVYNSYLAVR